MSTSVQLGAAAGYSWQLQSTDSLGTGAWIDIGDPIIGNDTLRQIEDPRPADVPQRFYRAVGIVLAP